MHSYQHTPHQDKAKAVIFIVVAAIFIWAFFIHDWIPDKPSGSFSKLEAYTMAQDFVKGQLKVPSTAEFTDSYNNCVEQVNDTTFAINSFVDSQNGFGAMIRSNYTCTIVYHSYNKTASCTKISVY